MDDVLQSVAGFAVGDGGGALLIEASDDPERGIIDGEFRSAPTEWRHAVGGYFRPATHACEACGSLLDRRFLCHGGGLFRAAFGLMCPTMEAVLARVGWTPDDLDVIFCHQPTKTFIDRALAVHPDATAIAGKLWGTAERYGNTSTASLPLALAEAKTAGALAPGTKILALAPSSGVSAAAVAMVW